SLLSLAAALVVHSFPTRRSSDLALAPGLLRCEAFADPQGRQHCGQSNGRCQHLNPDAAAGALPADVCQFRRLAACVELYLYHPRSEEHTSELQSRENLVCRLLLE